MTRRTPDPIALIFGAAFVTLGVVAIAGRVDLFASSQWIWPAVLVAVGIIMLAALVRRQPSPHQYAAGPAASGEHDAGDAKEDGPA